VALSTASPSPQPDSIQPPAWLLDVGFQLSVAACAGLMLTARPLEERLGGGLPRWVAAGVIVAGAMLVRLG
jgi:hypothetical protein